MDVQMPQMDGLEATRQIRSQWPERQIRIVAMTANVAPEDVRRCREAGMDAFLAKPIVVESLADVLRSLTDVSAPEKAEVLVDLEVVGRLVEQLGHDTVCEIANILFADCDAAGLALDDGCREHDRDVVASTAHSLKGSARSLGADVLGDLLQRLEEQAAGADWPALGRLIGQVHRQRDGVHDQLKAHLFS
jgi:CheY-like chemotaxis protein